MALLTVQDIETTIAGHADDERESYDALLERYREQEARLIEVKHNLDEVALRLDAALMEIATPKHLEPFPALAAARSHLWMALTFWEEAEVTQKVTP